MNERDRTDPGDLGLVWLLSLSQIVAAGLREAATEADALETLVKLLSARMPGRAVCIQTAVAGAPELMACAASEPWAGPPPGLLALTLAEATAAGLDPTSYAQAAAPKPMCEGSFTSARAPLAGPGLSGLLCLERSHVQQAEQAKQDELVAMHLAGVLSASLVAFRQRCAEQRAHGLVTRAIRQADPLVIVVNAERCVVFANRAVELLTGHRPEALSGRTLAEWVGDEPPGGLADAVERALLGHTVRGLEARLPLSTGGRVLSVLSVSPVVAADLQVEAAVAVGLSRRQLAALAMQVESQAVRRAEILREVTRRASDAARRLASAESTTFEQTVPQVAEELRLLVAGLQVLLQPADTAPEPLSLNAQVEAALETVGAEIAAQQVRLRTALAGDLPAVHGHARLLQLAVCHLVRNACQAVAPQGGHVTLRTWDNRNDTVGLSVSDDGVGIPETLLAQVTRPFVSHPRTTGRLGLGLTVVQDVIDRHDGSLELDSDEGEGTVVTLTLPVRSLRHPEGLKFA